MYTDLVVESAIRHVFINLPSSVSFPERQTLEVHSKRFLHDIVQRLVHGTSWLWLGVIIGENPRHLIAQNMFSVWSLLDIFLDAVQPPPEGISTIKPTKRQTNNIALEK